MSNNTTSGNLTSCTNKTGPGEDGPGNWRPPPLTTEVFVFIVVFSLLAVMIIFGNSLMIGVVLAISIAAWILAILAGSMREFLGTFYGMILVAVFFFVPFMVILGAYGKIAQVARAHAHGRGNLTFRKDLRIATTVAIVIGLFVICWTPFFALHFLVSFCVHKQFMTPMCRGLFRLPRVFLIITKLLWYTNSMCNPIIYGLRKNEFRQAFGKILRGLFCKKGGAR